MTDTQISRKPRSIIHIPISELILRAFSRDQQVVEKITNEDSKELENPLETLYQEYANFNELASGKKIADFGCGYGHQSIALIENFDCTVTGIDTHRKALSHAKSLAKQKNFPEDRLNFVESIPVQQFGGFDLVISQNSMEHFSDPVAILMLLKSLIKDDGKVLITFGPPWYSPYGSHMQFFCKLPWINILFSEKTVMTVRSLFRSDGVMHYEDVPAGLNKMSLAKFERIIDSCGMQIDHYKATAIKQLNFLTKIPIIRELFTNHVTVTLRKL